MFWIKSLGGTFKVPTSKEVIWPKQILNYRTRTIITRGLYFFTPFYSAVYNQERLILQTTYAVNKKM